LRIGCWNVDEVAASEFHEFVNNVSAFFFDVLLVQETGSLCSNDLDHTKHVVVAGESRTCPGLIVNSYLNKDIIECHTFDRFAAVIIRVQKVDYCFLSIYLPDVTKPRELFNDAVRDLNQFTKSVQRRFRKIVWVAGGDLNVELPSDGVCGTLLYWYFGRRSCSNGSIVGAFMGPLFLEHLVQCRTSILDPGALQFQDPIYFGLHHAFSGAGNRC
jgi:hypothetical protein